MIRTLTITTAALGLFAAAAAPAFAASASHDIVVHEHASSSTHEVKSKHVHYRDVDISTAHGAETLARRIENASERVCGGPHNRKTSLREKSEYKQCVSEAAEDAIRSVNSPAVTQAYKKTSS